MRRPDGRRDPAGNRRQKRDYAKLTLAGKRPCHAPVPGYYRKITDRGVIRVVIANLVSAWLVLQRADVLVAALGLPQTAVSRVLALLAGGFVIALLLARPFDITPAGLKGTDAPANPVSGIASVRKSRNPIRVTAKLVEAAADTQLWSETYDSELDDIFAIQDGIAASVLEALKLRLATPRSADKDSAIPEAHEYSLRRRGYAVSKSSRDMELAAEMFRKAVALAPEFLRDGLNLAQMCAIHAVFRADTPRQGEGRHGTCRCEVSLSTRPIIRPRSSGR